MKAIILWAFIIAGSCVYAQNNADKTLNGEWKLYYGVFDKNAPASPDELQLKNWPVIPAKVPGNVELDLLAAGEIKNPETGNNIYSLRKYEAFQWWYFKKFETPVTKSGERVELVFDGLDCIATVWVNNHFVGKPENMFIQHRFDITGVLNASGENNIFVCINPAVTESQKYLNATIGSRDYFNSEGQNIRKAPHMYGWDIMPRLISAGLWRDVRLEIIKTTHFKQVYWMTNSVNVEQKTAEMILDWEFSTDYPTVDGLTMEVTLNRNGKIDFERKYPLIQRNSRQRIYLENVDFWWPRGYGEPSLYAAILKILDENGNVLDEKTQKIGIRTADLIRTDIATKEKPGEFVFKINGEKIFVKGTNWVPLDALHSRDKSHLKEAMEMIVDLNCNLIRCWGGNVYEDTGFFDLCDANGVMVWQDFAMACTFYPLNPEFQDKIRKEATEVILKLRPHPSLVLWSGNNENDQSAEWTFKRPVDPGLDEISRKLLPGLIWEFDPIRPYLPSSPFASDEYFKNGRDFNSLPENHLWGPRGYYKASFYTEPKANFVSEIGYHGCPNRESLEKMFDKDFVYPWTSDGNWNDQWQTKAVRPHPLSTVTITRNNLMTNQVKAVFGDYPKDLDQFIFASQAVQAEAMKYFIELWRMDKFRRTGIIWWNLRDGWPIISDAVVDYYNSKKLAYYFIKQVQHDICVMIGDARDAVHPVVAVNDTREEKQGNVMVRDADSGETIFSGSFIIPANGKVQVGNIPQTKNQAMWLIDYSIGNERFTNHYLAGIVPFKLEDYQRWYKKLNIARN